MAGPGIGSSSLSRQGSPGWLATRRTVLSAMASRSAMVIAFRAPRTIFTALESAMKRSRRNRFSTGPWHGGALTMGMLDMLYPSRYVPSGDADLAPADFIDALVSGLATPEERERRPLMVLQTGYFDDSGSDHGSRWYVLAGFLATVDEWKAVANAWAKTLKREELPYFKMSHAMALDGPFRRGWTPALRNKLILELVDVVTEINPWRVECFINRSLFEAFVKGILESEIFNDPYFMLFYQIVLSVCANAERLGWSPDCDFIFDEQGKLGDITRAKWEWVKQNIDNIQSRFRISQHLGSRPIPRNDVTFRPLQAADMFAWLVRDCMTIGGDNMEETPRAALKLLEGKDKIIRLHIAKEQLMELGASFLVGKAQIETVICEAVSAGAKGKNSIHFCLFQQQPVHVASLRKRPKCCLAAGYGGPASGTMRGLKFYKPVWKVQESQGSIVSVNVKRMLQIQRHNLKTGNLPKADFRSSTRRCVR